MTMMRPFQLLALLLMASAAHTSTDENVVHDYQRRRNLGGGGKKGSTGMMMQSGGGKKGNIGRGKKGMSMSMMSMEMMDADGDGDDGDGMDGMDGDGMDGDGGDDNMPPCVTEVTFQFANLACEDGAVNPPNMCTGTAVPPSPSDILIFDSLDMSGVLFDTSATYSEITLTRGDGRCLPDTIVVVISSTETVIQTLTIALIQNNDCGQVIPDNIQIGGFAVSSVVCTDE